MSRHYIEVAEEILPSGDIPGAICDECGAVVGPHGCCRTIRQLEVEANRNCRYECYNGLILTGIVEAIGIIHAESQKMDQLITDLHNHQRWNQDDANFHAVEVENIIAHLDKARAVLARCLQIGDKAHGVHHGVPVEIEMELRGGQR